MEPTLSIKVPIKKRSCAKNWLKKAFTSTPQTEYSQIWKQNSIEGPVWTPSPTKYHPSGYYKLKSDGEILYHGPVLHSKSLFPHAHSASSHAYSSNEVSPKTPYYNGNYRLPTIAHHDTLSGSFLHPRQDTPIRNETYRLPTITHHDTLSGSFLHPRQDTPTGNDASSPSESSHESSHAYGEQTRPAPPRPRVPFSNNNSKNVVYNKNKALPDISYLESKPKFPHPRTESSHAYDACIPGPSSLSHAREKACKRAREQTNTDSADWERDWDVPLSQRTGSSKVLHQTKGKGIQIRNRQSIVAMKGKEQRNDEGGILKGKWKREGRVKLAAVSEERWVEAEAENPFQGNGGE